MTLALLFTPGWARWMRGVMGLFPPLLGLWKGINKKKNEWFKLLRAALFLSTFKAF